MCIHICSGTGNIPVTGGGLRPLNDEMLRYGVLSTEECGGYLDVDCGADIYPGGIIYGDIIDFDNSESPYLVIFRADSSRGCVSADIYKFDETQKVSSLVSIISKGYNVGEGVWGEMTVGYNNEKRYIVYNEYKDGEKIRSEFYTVIDGTAFVLVSPPAYAEETGVLSFKNTLLHPEVDISVYNKYLCDFFYELKDDAAKSVTYEDISDMLSEKEEERIEGVMSGAAKFSSFDIGNYSNISEYKDALKEPDADNIFYSITHLYDLDRQLYYVRFATEKSFYNYAILRRTPTVEEGYQILSVRCDCIPLSDIELENAIDAYTHNKLVYKKAHGKITEKQQKQSGEKPIRMSKPISADVRKPIAFIGGGICLVLFVIFWMYIANDD